MKTKYIIIPPKIGKRTFSVWKRGTTKRLDIVKSKKIQQLNMDLILGHISWEEVKFILACDTELIEAKILH